MRALDHHLSTLRVPTVGGSDDAELLLAKARRNIQ